MAMPDLQQQLEQLRVLLDRTADLIEALIARLPEVKHGK